MPSVLITSLPDVQEDFATLSDANKEFDRSAFRNSVEWFKEPEVEGLCDQLNMLEEATSSDVGGFHWPFENLLDQFEAWLDTVVHRP